MDKETYAVVPSATVSTITVMGVVLQDWVYLATLVYTIVMIVRLSLKTYHEEKTRLRIEKKLEQQEEGDEIYEKC